MANFTYSLTFDAGRNTWQPCDVHARIIDQNNTYPLLKERFDVVDAGGGAWVAGQKLVVSNRVLTHNGTAAQFTVQPAGALTVEDLLQVQGRYSLRVLCYLNLAVAPGMGLPVPVDMPVAGTCALQVQLPAQIETRLERAADDEAFLVSARVQFLIPLKDPTTLKAALASLKFQPESSKLMVSPPVEKDGWKTVRVTARDIDSLTPAALGLQMTAQAGYQPLQARTVVPFAQSGRVKIECRPNSLELSEGNSLEVYASPIFRDASKWTPEQTAGVIQSLNLEIDTAAAPWIEAGARQVNETCAVWALTPRQPQPLGELPPQARITVKGQMASSPVEDSETIALLADTDYELSASIQGRKEAQVLFNKTADTPGWQFPEIRLFFHRPKDTTPCQVHFACSEPQLKDDQDILQFEVLAENGATPWTVRASLKETDLDEHPGTTWLEENGLTRVTVMVETQGEPRKKFEQSITYHLRPQVELVLSDEEGAAGKPAGHAYQDVPLEPFEFVCDGEDGDALALAAGFRRTDWPAEDDRRLAFGSFQDASPALVGEEKDEYQVVDVQEQDGQLGFAVQSQKPLLFSSDRAARRGLKLHLAGQLSAEAPGNYIRSVPPLEVTLQPRFMVTKLWVVPGQERGTSTACAAVFFRRGSGQLHPVGSAPLDLEVKSPGFTVTAEPMEHLQKTGGSHGVQNVPVPDQLTVWRLHYQGLKWSTLERGLATVYCRFKDAQEAVTFKINIAENLASMVADLDAHANGPELDLTNSEWQSYSTMGLSGVLLARRECRGFLYNARSLAWSAVYAAAGKPMPADFQNFLQRYTCGEYSQRLRKYLVRRRNGKKDPNIALRMNGIECCQYTLPGVHDWFGFYLSGNSLVAEPIFIDPWWTQEWHIDEVKFNYGFKKQAALTSLVITLLAAEMMIVASFLIESVSTMMSTGLRGALSWSAGGISRPSFSKVVTILKDILKRWGWQIANVLANVTTWYLETPNNSDQSLFDDQFNYSYYCEMELFEYYFNEAQKSEQGAPLKVETWQG